MTMLPAGDPPNYGSPYLPTYNAPSLDFNSYTYPMSLTTSAITLRKLLEGLEAIRKVMGNKEFLCMLELDGAMYQLYVKALVEAEMPIPRFHANDTKEQK